RYAEAGVNMTIGTDTYPHDMFDEMRLALYLGRTDARRMAGTSTAEIFHAATVSGANALRRGDIGRLKVGAKADIVLVDLDHPLMQPARDPLRSLISSAGSRPIRHVVVDGRFVVRDRRLETLDYQGAAAELGQIAKLNEEKICEVDVVGRTGEQLAPLSLPRLSLRGAAPLASTRPT